MLTRRGFMRWLLGLSAAAAATGAYAFEIEPGWRLRVRRWDLRPPLWPRGRHLRIAVLADLHAGEPHMGRERVRRIVDRANGLGADLIALVGDYAQGHRFTRRPATPDEVADDLSALSAPLGVWAVLGNHDWWDDPAAQAKAAGPTETHRAFAARGIPVLENAAVRLEGRQGPFWLAGLGDQLAFRGPAAAGRAPNPAALTPRQGVDDLPRALAALTDDAPAILLAHEPDIFPRVPRRVALTLAGHTHGGQVRLLGWSPVVPSAYGSRYAYGPVEEHDRTLVVSGGLGCSLAPIRFGAPPEITLIDLS
ncbi:MAG: metallophosphoesterase [Pseudomonadota bacterium]